MFFRFIYVDYSAWQYARSDNLWLGIITTLAEKIEQELGVYTTRVFRSLSLDLIERPVFKRVEYLLIELKDNENRYWSTEDIKKSFEKQNISNYIELAKWIKDYKYDIDIANKENCWIVEFDNMKKAQEVYKELQNYDDLNVSILKTPDRSLKPKKNAKNLFSFFKHFGGCLRLDYILLSLGTIVVIFTSTTLFTYALVHDSMNNSEKSVGARISQLLFCFTCHTKIVLILLVKHLSCVRHLSC